jgi:hypothetical protein
MQSGTTYFANSLLLNDGAYPSPLHSAPPTCHLHALRARPHQPHDTRHVTRTSAQPRPRPPTHPRRRLRLSLLLAPSDFSANRAFAKARGRRRADTHSQAGRHGAHTPHKSMAHGPHTHTRELPTHPPTHALCVRRPQTHAHTYDSLSGLLRCLG